MPGRGAAGAPGITGRAGLPSLIARSGRGGTTGRAAGWPASVRPEGGDRGAPWALGDGADGAGAPGRISGRGRWVIVGRETGPGIAAPGPETRPPSEGGLDGIGCRGPERIWPGRGLPGPGKGLATGGAGRPGAITATGGICGAGDGVGAAAGCGAAACGATACGAGAGAAGGAGATCGAGATSGAGGRGVS
jgi:hypothetical protein